MRLSKIDESRLRQIEVLTGDTHGWDTLDPLISEFLESLRDGVIVVGADQRVKYLNSSYLRQFDLGPAELHVGQSLSDALLVLAQQGKLGAMHGCTPEEIAAARVATWGMEESRLERRPLPSGEVLEIYRTATTHGDLISISVDVTELDRSAQELDRQRTYMQSVLENTSDAITLLDADLNFVMFNDKLLELYDVDPSKVYWGISYDEMSRQFGDLRHLSSEERATEIARRRQFVTSPDIMTLRRPLGDGRTLNLNKTNLTCGGRVLTIRDVTEDLAREREMIETQRATEENNRNKSEFLARMSHEMRTPMNGILGSAALLDRTELDPRQRKLVDVVANSGTVLLRLIDDILDLSRIEAGSFEIIEEEMNFIDVIDRCLGIVAPGANAASLEIRYGSMPETLPDVYGDLVRIKQIILNLLTNAVKFTEKGYVEVSLDAEEGPEGITLALGIRDTGVGIAADKLEQIFERFYQIDGTATRQHGGAGLGLAITQRLVDLMGGAIQVSSTPGEGTTFRVTLTLRPVLRESGRHKRTR